MAKQVRNMWVNTADLLIDPRVQGVRRESRVQDMATSWDQRAANTISISQRRDDTLYVIDGQHRTAAALERKVRVLTTDAEGNQTLEWEHEPVARLWAQVHTGLTLAEEAQMYVLLNNTKVPQAVDRIAVAAIGGDPVAELLVNTGAKYGWYLKKAPRIQANQALYKIAQWDEDGVILDRVFHVLTDAWQHDADATRGDIVEGLAKLIQFRPHLDDKRLARVLNRSTPSTVLADVKQLRPAFKSRARMTAIAVLYDRGLGESRKLLPNV